MKHSVWLIAIWCVAGCTTSLPTHESLPRHPLVDDRSLIAAMSQEFHSIHDVAAQGELHLTEANGDHVTLDVVMAVRPPREARMRAYKFGQAVFDLTMTPAGVWLLTNDPHAAKLQVTGAQFGRSMTLLSGELLDQPGLTMTDENELLILTRNDAGEPTVRCTIDRSTRTIRRYELLDDQGKVRFSLTQSQFVDQNGIDWPRRIIAISDRGTIDISLVEVNINEGLPPDAFVPPHRATRLP